MVINKCGKKFKVCLLIDVVVWKIVIIRLINKFGIMIVDINFMIKNSVLLSILIKIFGFILFFLFNYVFVIVWLYFKFKVFC